MRRGFEPSTSSSAPRVSRPRTRHPPQQPGTHARDNVPDTLAKGSDEPRQSQPTSSRGRSIPSQALAPPQGTIEPQSAPIRPKSPAYLQGKNPYGRILEKVEHPYHESKPTRDGPPSQVGSSIEGRPRTSGSFNFVTRPVQAEPEQTVAAPATQAPLLPPLQPPRPVSVKNTKIYFETRASNSRAVAPLPPSTRGTRVKCATSDREAHDQSPQAPPPQRLEEEEASQTLDASSRTRSSLVRRVSDPQLPIPRPPPDAPKRTDPFQRTSPFVRQQPKSVGPVILVESPIEPPQAEKKAAAPPRHSRSHSAEVLVVVDSASDSPAAVNEDIHSRRRSTNVFELPPRVSKPPSFEKRAVAEPRNIGRISTARRSAFERPRDSVKSAHAPSFNQLVRRSSARRPLAAAESSASEEPERAQILARTESGRVVRSTSVRPQSTTSRSANKVRELDGLNSGEETVAAFQHRPPGSCDRRATTRRSRSQDSYREPLEQPLGSTHRTSKSDHVKAAATNLDQNIETYVRTFGEPIDVAEKLVNIAAQSFSHDGSSPEQKNHSTYVIGRTTRDDREEDRQDVEVPDHVDWRGAYGRRKTQDFGFPGARIKPRGSYYRKHFTRQLQDPGNWIKRTCGHFSRVDRNESREAATRLPCRECLEKSAMSSDTTAKHSGARKRAATDSSTTSSSSWNKSNDDSNHTSRRRQHHSEYIPTDRCGNAFAKDLGTIIDAILEEHADTLEHVISNIRSSQPSLRHLRRLSQDLVYRQQRGGTCGTPCQTCQCAPCEHRHVCQRVCQPVCQHVCEYVPPCPYVPPRATEKLNVGEPGQVNPNLNDRRSTLRQSTKSVPDLIGLVNSAADDLGVDLDNKPSPQDEEKFNNAPFEEAPRSSMVSSPNVLLETVEEQVNEENGPGEDIWLQTTRRQLSELSETRSQLMDELDTIADDLGAQLQELNLLKQKAEPIQGTLDRVSTGLSEESPRPRNKSVDAVADEIPSMLDQETKQKRLSRVLTRIRTQSRRISSVSQALRDLDDNSPEEIQDGFDVTQSEVPAATVERIVSPVSSRHPTVERIVSPVLSRHPTVAERRMTIERRLSHRSKQPTIESQPSVLERRPTTFTRIAKRQPTATEQPTDLELADVTLPISRQPTRRRTELDQAAVLDRHATDLPTLTERTITMAPTSVPRQHTRRATEPFEPNVVLQRYVTKKPTVQEDELTPFEPQLRRQSATVSRRATRVPTERVEEIKEFERQPTSRQDESSFFRRQTTNLEDTPVPLDRQPTRQNTVVSRRATRVPMDRVEESGFQRQLTNQDDEPTLIERQFTPQFKSLSPRATTDLIERLVEPDGLERQPTRQTNLDLSRASTSVAEEPIISIKAARVSSTVSREPTLVEATQTFSSEEGISEGSSFDEPGVGLTIRNSMTRQSRLPSPDIPENPVRRISTSRPTRREQEPSTIEEGSPSPPSFHTYGRVRVSTDPSVDIERVPTQLVELPSQEAELDELISTSLAENSPIYSEHGDDGVIRRTTPTTVSYESETPRRASPARAIADDIESLIEVSTTSSRQVTQIEEPEEGLPGVEMNDEAPDLPEFNAPEIDVIETTLDMRDTAPAVDQEISEGFEEAPPRRLSRVATEATISSSHKPSIASRPSRRSTEIVADEALMAEDEPEITETEVSGLGKRASIISRKPTAISRHTTELLRQDPMPSRLSPVRERTATLEQSEERLVSPHVSRQSTSISRRPTATERSPSFPIRRMTTLSRSLTGRNESSASLRDEILAPDPVARASLPSPRPSRQQTNVSRRPTIQERISSPARTMSRQQISLSRPATLRQESPLTRFMSMTKAARSGSTLATESEQDTSEEGDAEDASMDAISAMPSRQSTTVSRQPTAVSRRSTVPEENSPRRFVAVTRMAQRDSEYNVEPEPEPETPVEFVENGQTEQPDLPINTISPSGELKLRRELDRQPTSTYEQPFDAGPTRESTVPDHALEPEPTTPFQQDEKDVEDLALSRRPSSIVSAGPTRRPTESVQLNETENPAPSSRRAASKILSEPTPSVSRRPTLVSTISMPPDEEEELPQLSRRITTYISHQPTHIASTPLLEIMQEQEALKEYSSSPQSSVLDDPLATFDVYNATPAPPLEYVREPTPEEQQPSLLSRISTSKHAAHERRPSATIEKLAPQQRVVQEGPNALYSPYPPPHSQFSQLTLAGADTRATAPLQPVEPGLEFLPHTETYQRPSGRQSTIPIDSRLPTVEHHRKPASIAPSPTSEKAHIEVSGLPHDEGIVKASPNSRVADAWMPPPAQRVHSVLPERQRRMSSAPGIVAPPVDTLPSVMRNSAPYSRPQHAEAVPPDQQYPPTPPYPIRDSPTWVRLDIYERPPKPKPTSLPKTKQKSRSFGWGDRPKEQTRSDTAHFDSMSQALEPEPVRDQPQVEPFRTAAPGPAPGSAPGGTQERPRTYRAILRTETNYYPPPTRDDYGRYRPAPARDINSGPAPRQTDDDYAQRSPATARDVYSGPPPSEARSDQAQPFSLPSQPGEEVRASEKTSLQLLQSQAPDSLRYESPAQQGLRNEEKVSPRVQTPSPLRRPQDDLEPYSSDQISQQETPAKAVRRDVLRSSQAKEDTILPPTEKGSTRDNQASSPQNGIFQTLQSELAPHTRSERERGSTAEGAQEGRRRPSDPGADLPRTATGAPVDQARGVSAQDRIRRRSSTQRTAEGTRTPRGALSLAPTRRESTRETATQGEEIPHKTQQLAHEGQREDIPQDERPRRETDHERTQGAFPRRPSTALERRRRRSSAQRSLGGEAAPSRAGTAPMRAATIYPEIVHTDRRISEAENTWGQKPEDAGPELRHGDTQVPARDVESGPQQGKSPQRTHTRLEAEEGDIPQRTRTGLTSRKGTVPQSTRTGTGLREDPKRVPTISRAPEAIQVAPTGSNSRPRRTSTFTATTSVPARAPATTQISTSAPLKPPNPTDIIDKAELSTESDVARRSSPPREAVSRVKRGSVAPDHNQDYSLRHPPVPLESPPPAKGQPRGWNWLGGGRASGKPVTDQRAQPPAPKLAAGGERSGQGHIGAAGGNGGQGRGDNKREQQPGKGKVAATQGTLGLRGRWGWG